MNDVVDELMPNIIVVFVLPDFVVDIDDVNVAIDVCDDVVAIIVEVIGGFFIVIVWRGPIFLFSMLNVP